MANPHLLDWCGIIPKPKISSFKLSSSAPFARPPFHDTLVSAMRVYPIQSEYNPIEILKFICVQFIARMEVIVVAQRGTLIIPDNKLTNMKNEIGKILSGKGTDRSKQLLPYIPGILLSDILSKPWRHFINEHIIQPHVDKNASVRSHDDSRSSASEDQECDEESAPPPAGGARCEVPAAHGVLFRIPKVCTRTCSPGASVARFAATLSRSPPLPLPPPRKHSPTLL